MFDLSFVIGPNRVVQFANWVAAPLGLFLILYSQVSEEYSYNRNSPVGVVLFVIGAIAYFRRFMRKRRNRNLVKNGLILYPEFHEIGQNTSVSINGVNPFTVIAKWYDESGYKTYYFASHNFWFDPKPHVTQKEITVYVDSSNPLRYFVDLSFSKKLRD
ncbi:MAG: hypothetical protein ACREO1_12720 [Arenimonas sp.]